MEQSPISFDTLCDHYRNYEARVAALEEAMIDEAKAYYHCALEIHGLKVGDYVKYHNATYLVTEYAILVKCHNSNPRVDFALDRCIGTTSFRWLPLQFIDELVKIKD